MPRVKPTTIIDVIGNLDLSPEKAVGEYLASKEQQKFFIKAPKWDTPGDSIDRLYLENRREHEAMLKLQQDMLENARKHRVETNERIETMKKTQEELRERFIEVNTFMKDCKDKKLDAERIVTEQIRVHDEQHERIAYFRKSIEELKAFRESLRETVAEFEPYERILEQVVEKSDIFTSPKDCMDRCDALTLAQAEIHRLEQIKLKEIEEMRTRMVKLTNEAALAALGLKNELSTMERSYSETRAMCLKWEQILANAKDTVLMHELNKVQTLDAIQVLYKLLCKRRDMEPKFLHKDVDQEMDFIKKEVDVLKAVLKEIEDDAAMKAESLDEEVV